MNGGSVVGVHFQFDAPQTQPVVGKVKKGLQNAGAIAASSVVIMNEQKNLSDMRRPSRARHQATIRDDLLRTFLMDAPDEEARAVQQRMGQFALRCNAA